MTEYTLPADATSRELEIGKAAEHIVCADLILAGYRAYLSDQGLPYDVVLDHEGGLLRVQVKSTLVAKNVNTRGKNERIAYSFGVRRRGKRGTRSLCNSDCDLVALVALDIRVVAYLPVDIVGQTFQISPSNLPAKTKTWRLGWLRTISQWPISDALIGASAYEKVQRLPPADTHCIHGHEYIAVGGRRSYGCPECNRIKARAALARKVLI